MYAFVFVSVCFNIGETTSWSRTLLTVDIGVRACVFRQMLLSARYVRARVCAGQKRDLEVDEAQSARERSPESL